MKKKNTHLQINTNLDSEVKSGPISCTSFNFYSGKANKSTMPDINLNKPSFPSSPLMNREVKRSPVSLTKPFTLNSMDATNSSLSRNFQMNGINGINGMNSLSGKRNTQGKFAIPKSKSMSKDRRYPYNNSSCKCE
jgi:hypothetical protein